MSNPSKRSVFGKGVNDVDYETQKFVKISETKWGCIWICPYYKTWKHMLERCLCPKLKKKYPTYKDVVCTEKWLKFSNFKAWMEQQDWEGKHLDKDLLLKNNKVYCPERCVFVPKSLNNFLTDTQRTRVNNLPKGVYWNKQHHKYQVRVSNPFTNKRENLGYFECLGDAEKAYNKRKYEIALMWGEVLSDERLKKALTDMKLNLQ